MEDKTRQLLENYRYYKFALDGYEAEEPELSKELMEKYQSAAPARVVRYSETPKGMGSGSQEPRLTGLWSQEDHKEYKAVKKAVERIECAIDLLTATERKIITLKYMQGLTLAQVGAGEGCSREWAKKHHRRALAKLTESLMFDEVTEINKNISGIP